MAQHVNQNNDLLAATIDAHGGIDRFNRIREVHYTIDRSGLLWVVKGYPAHNLINILVEPKIPKVTFRHLDGNQDDETLWIWTPGRVWKETPQGQVTDSRDSPRESTKGHTLTTPWDHLQLLYFSGYAIWNYTCAPFYFSWPGFKVQEIANPLKDPVGEKWRVLEVTYPLDMDVHGQVQKYFFDEKFALRRLDYSVDILGGSSTVHMCYDHKMANGLLVPRLRRALRDPEGFVDGGPSTVLLDIWDVVVKDE